MSAFDEAAIWPAAKAAGILYAAQWAAAGCPAKTVYVDYLAPGSVVLGMVSTEHTIEYQAADMPGLAEGDEIIVALPTGDTMFRVRKPTQNTDAGGTGFFKYATLTEVR